MIFFDVYGTLISTGGGSVLAAQKILEKRRSDAEPAAFYARWKQLHKALSRQADFVPEREIFRLGLAELYRIYSIDGDPGEDVGIMLDTLYHRRAFPDTLPALARLRGNYRLALASNTDDGPLEETLRQNGLNLNWVFTSEALRCYKPHPDFYRQILSAMGCRPEEAVFVGDSGEEDVIGPKQAGMTAVLVDRKGTGLDFGQDQTVADLSELMI